MIRKHASPAKKEKDAHGYIFGVNSSAHYRQGVALQHMNRHSEALAAFATAVAHDPGSEQLLQTLIEAGLKSPLQATLSPLFAQLQDMGRDNDPFVITSIIGQELLSVREVYPAITVLEASLQIGTSDVKLKESVLSALSSAHWKTGNTKRAMRYMEDDLKTAEELEDEAGQCRAHGNLGNAFYSQNMYKKSLKHHKLQLNIATKLQDGQLIAEALTSLGHVYVSTGDLSSALASHKRCLVVRKELNDRAAEGKELGNVGSVYTLMGDYRNASQYHLESLRVAEEIQDKNEAIRSCNNLGSLYYNMRQFDDSVTYLIKAVNLAVEQGDLSAQCRALGGLGHTYRGQMKLEESLRCHDKQLKIAIKITDRSSEARARSNIGVVLQQKGQFRQALDFHKTHLVICRELRDKDGESRACGNIGNAYHSLGQYERAVKYHKYAIALSKELRDQHSEASLHGNLAVAFQALEMYDEAEAHYKKYRQMMRDLNDLHGECQAESNLGNFYVARGNPNTAVEHYSRELTIAEKLDNVDEMAKACHSLGYAFYLKKSYDDSIEYYERNIRLATKRGERATLTTAYCNLGLAYLAVNDFEKAAASQKKFLLASTEKKNVYNICKALGNIGDVYFKEENFTEALRYFSEKLKVAEESKIETQKAVACNKLGKTYFCVGNYRKALELYNKELTLVKNFNETSKVFDCLENIANVQLAKRSFKEAYATYLEQLELSKKLKEDDKEARSHNNLGLSLIQLESHEDALKEFEKQLEILIKRDAGELEEGRCRGNIAECYFYLKNFKESLRSYQLCLDLVSTAGSVLDEDMAYKCLSAVHKAMGNMQEARVCTEKRLVLSQDVEDAVKCEAYSELAEIHLSMENLDQAISYFENQRKIAKESGNVESEISAVGGLGRVHEKSGTFEQSLKFHLVEYELAERSANLEAEGKAASSLGLIYKHLGKYPDAVKYCEKALAVGSQLKDEKLQLLVQSRLALIKHLMCRNSECFSHLQKVKDIAGRTKSHTEVIKTYFRLGMCEFVQGNYTAAEKNFQHVFTLGVDMAVKEDGKEIANFVAAAYQMQQRTLAADKKYLDALKVAEKARLFECRIGMKSEPFDKSRLEAYQNSSDTLLKHLKKLDSVVLYYSIAGGQILLWLLAPGKGIVKFTMIPLLDGYGTEDFEGADLDDIPHHVPRQVTEILDVLIKELRESIGVGAFCSKTELRRHRSFDCEMVEILTLDQMPLKKYSRIGQRASAFSPPTKINKTTYNFSMKQKPSNVVQSVVDSEWAGKARISQLYNLLIRPVRKEFNVLRSKESEAVNMLIVVPNDLLLVPFSLLKDSSATKYFAESFKIRTTTSLAFAYRGGGGKKEKPIEEPFRDVIVNGNEVGVKEEVTNMKKILGADVIALDDGEKADFRLKLSTANIIHFAAKVAWSSASLVLSGEEVGRVLCSSPNSEPEFDSFDSSSRVHFPAMPDILLSAEEISTLDLHAKLIVFSVSQVAQHEDSVSSDTLASLINAFQLAGAEAVIVSHWPLSNPTAEAFFASFYEKFEDGADICDAFQQSVLVVKQTPSLSHPTNWAGFLLSGKNISLHKKRASLAQVLHLLLERPNRDAIKVLLHLVEKARQRIAQGRRTSMYTTEASVKAKVGDVLGWQELLTMVGFRFERASSDLPSSVFFPWTDHVGILNRCSNTLYAFLGLTRVGMDAMSKLRSAPEVASSLVSLLRDVIGYFSEESSNVQVPLSIKVWRVPGCHELLSSLGFDLMGVGRDEVVLRSGRCNLRRPLQCALQAIIDLFEAEDIEGDFMCSVNGRAASEIQLRNRLSGSQSLSRESIDSGYHPVRKARSSPIKPVTVSMYHDKGSHHGSGDLSREVNGHADRNNNGISLLSLQTKVGLFGGKGSESDVGPSARRLRGRGSSTNVTRSPDDDNYGKPLSNESAKMSSSLKRFKTSESLLDLAETPNGHFMTDGPLFYQEGTKSIFDSSSETADQDAWKSQTLPSRMNQFPSSNNIPIPGNNSSHRKVGNTNSLPRRILSKSDSFPIDDLSEEEVPGRVWKLSEDSDTSMSSNTSAASKGSVKFSFEGPKVSPMGGERGGRKTSKGDAADYYSKNNFSLIIRNKLAGSQLNNSVASITRGTTIIDALRLEKKDSISSAEGISPDKRPTPLHSKQRLYRPRGSISSGSTDSANIIENRPLSQDSPASPPSSLPSSLSSIHSSEEAARLTGENMTAFQMSRRKRVSSVNGSLVISRI